MKKVKLLLVFLAGAVTYLLASLFFATEPKDPYLGEMSENEVVNSAPAIQMYFYIKKYAKQYGVPEAYAFAVAYRESRYKGPLDLNYEHRLTSSGGAVGPMQVMVATARYINRDHVSKDRLRTDIQYNVRTSMKLLRRLYDRRHDWKVVFGEYNTGRPCINGYSHKVYNHKLTW